MNKENYDIVCLSHLKWERTLFQRPQQIMRRFSKKNKVIYIANCSIREFIKALFKGRIRDYIGWDNKNLFFLTLPYLPLTGRIRFFQKLTYKISSFIARFFARKFKFRNIYLWVYYPTFVDNLDSFNYKKLIYDCMDLFRGFKSSSGNVQDLENRLLKKSDIVFTGGRSLQKSKEGVNPKTYCFPSGVEYKHFFKATLKETPIPEDMKGIKGPVLGYFGAVDERIDFKLIKHICEKKPEWSVVFLGPLVGFQECPIKMSNFHFLGKKNYSDLPSYLKAFDVCLMPFVISELTLHISPTKTPEYLAGGKPVVSTPIPDVITDYSDVVEITGDYDEFIESIERMLKDERGDLHERIRKKAETKSWDYIAEEMKKLISELE
jgi:UDP-galactopyranose mutase